MKKPKVIKVMEHYKAYEPDKPISKKNVPLLGRL